MAAFRQTDEECLLEHVLGASGVVDDPHGDAKCHLLVPIVEGGERLLVSDRDAFHQRGICRCTVHCLFIHGCYATRQSGYVSSLCSW